MKSKALRRKAALQLHSEPRVPKDAMAPMDDDKMEPNEEADAKGHMATLLEAEEIKKDEKKMANVHKHAKRQIGKIGSLQDLKDVAALKGGKAKTGYVAS